MELRTDVNTTGKTRSSLRLSIAGGGYFTWHLAEAVGPQGTVYAVEIDETRVVYPCEGHDLSRDHQCGAGSGRVG